MPKKDPEEIDFKNIYVPERQDLVMLLTRRNFYITRRSFEVLSKENDEVQESISIYELKNIYNKAFVKRFQNSYPETKKSIKKIEQKILAYIRKLQFSF